MKKWIAGMAATVISGIIIFWLTQGVHKKVEPKPSLPDQSIHISGVVKAGRDVQFIFNPFEIHSNVESDKEQRKTSQITLENFFCLGVIFGTPLAATINRFPEESVYPTPEQLKALRFFLIQVQYKDVDTFISSYKRVIKEFDESHGPDDVARVLPKFMQLKERIDVFVSSNYGGKEKVTMQLGINMPDIRRCLFQMRELDKFRTRGEIDTSEYEKLVRLAVELMGPQISFLKNASVSNYLDYNKEVRRSVTFIANTNLISKENRDRAWEELKNIAFEFHTLLPDKYEIRRAIK